MSDLPSASDAAAAVAAASVADGEAATKGFVLSMISKVPSIVWISLGFGAWVLWSLYRGQNSMLYVPRPPGLPDPLPPPYSSPADWGMQWDEQWFAAADGTRLHGWFIRASPQFDSKTAPTILFFHANAGSINLRLPNFDLLTAVLGCNVFAFDYRGYGRSAPGPVLPGVSPTEQGPDEKGLRLDGEAALRFLQEKAKRGDIDGRKVFFFGRSLGGAVALHTVTVANAAAAGGAGAVGTSSTGTGAAAPDRALTVPAGLILENTFTSVPAMVDRLFPWLTTLGLKRFLLKIDWNSLAVVPSLPQPVLFISGERDTLVPPAMMRELFSAAESSSDREWLSIAGGDHNDTFQKGGALYARKFKAFIDRTLTRNLGEEEAKTKVLFDVMAAAEAQEAAREREKKRLQSWRMVGGVTSTANDQQQQRAPAASAPQNAASSGASKEGEKEEEKTSFEVGADGEASAAVRRRKAEATTAQEQAQDAPAPPIGAVPSLAAAFKKQN